MTKKNAKKQMLASGMAVLMIGSSAFPVYAAEPAPQASEKEEVVYITLDSDGSLKNTYVVNSFAGGNVLDYGNYSSVKMLNVSDPIQQKGDVITFSSSADKVYYQGNLKETEIPWNISVRYFLDGKEYTPEEIAGKSGDLKIQLQVTKNKDCQGSFFDDYALQAAFTMDTKQCKKIKAEDAVVANVGSKKQISYTILPGKGIDTSITAKVKDFEMSEMSINGVHLNLNVDIEDDALKGKVGELMDAVKKLDNGAAELYDGSGRLSNGSSDLQVATSAMHSGSKALDEGILTLQNGLNEVQNGLNSLNQKSNELVNGSAEFKKAMKTVQKAVNSVSATGEDLTELATASGEVKQALGQLSEGAAALQENLGYAQYKNVMAQNGLDIDQVIAGNNEILGYVQQYEDLLNRISAEVPGAAGIVEQYRPQLTQVSNQFKLLAQGNNGAITGMQAYLDGVSAELPALTNGLAELNTNYAAFDDAIHKLVNGLGDMTGNLSKLADGINQLVENYEKIDSGIGGYTDGVAQIVAGYNQVINGVSALADGSRELVAGSDQLHDGTKALYDGVISLCDGAKEMSEGTGQFRAETSGMDEKIDEEIDGILGTIGGSMENPVSFVSSRNTNVDSVQFVIRTDSIGVEEKEETETVETEKVSFVQKFLNLFR